jgi:hypothetical protein
MEEGRSQPHPDPPDILMVAYDQRVLQLYDARAALAEAVAALTLELSRSHEQRDQARAEIRRLGEQQEILRRHAAALEAELATVRGMKVVRWTKWPRTLVYRLRARHR